MNVPSQCQSSGVFVHLSLVVQTQIQKGKKKSLFKLPAIGNENIDPSRKKGDDVKTVAEI